jgi:hypothetical protein
MKTQDFFFYVEPEDSHTNESFARILVDELRISKRKVNDDSGSHVAETLWQCTLAQLKTFEANRISQNLHFLTYSAKTSTGSIQRFKLLNKKLRKESRTIAIRNQLNIVRRAKKRLLN